MLIFFNEMVFCFLLQNKNVRYFEIKLRKYSLFFYKMTCFLFFLIRFMLKQKKDLLLTLYFKTIEKYFLSNTYWFWKI